MNNPAAIKLLHFAKTCALAVSVAAALGLASPAQAQLNAFKDPAPGGSGVAAGPDLKATMPTITGGQVSVGATAYVVAVFKNPGTSPVNITGINLYPSSTVTADVSLNKCAEAPLPPEAECAVTVAVTGMQIGSWRVELLLDHDGRTRLATAAMTGTVESAGKVEDEVIKADIEAVPAELDFGAANGSLPLVRSILLRNRTQQPVNLKSITLDAPAQTGFSFRQDCPETLQPSETCGVLVTWSPLTKGVSQGVLDVLHTAKSALTQVQVLGTFEPASSENAAMYPASVPEKGLLIADKDKIDFGDGINGASAITISLVNAGTEDVTLRSIKLSGSDSGVSIARSGCRAGTVLPPLEACALTINWLPSREGEVIDDLQIHHTGARGVLLLPVRGKADAAISRESLAVRQAGAEGEDGLGHAEVVSVTPVLDGYVVTTLSPTKAIINGPVGRIVVRDGEDTVISGVKWTVTIVPTGVILTSAADEILLVFDKSLKPLKVSTAASSDTESDSDSETETETTTSQ
jgi:hypothetical protein